MSLDPERFRKVERPRDSDPGSNEERQARAERFADFGAPGPRLEEQPGGAQVDAARFGEQPLPTTPLDGDEPAARPCVKCGQENGRFDAVCRRCQDRLDSPLQRNHHAARWQALQAAQAPKAATGLDVATQQKLGEAIAEQVAERETSLWRSAASSSTSPFGLPELPRGFDGPALIWRLLTPRLGALAMPVWFGVLGLALLGLFLFERHGWPAFACRTLFILGGLATVPPGYFLRGNRADRW